MKILGIETSADETSIAVVENGTRIIDSLVRSQIEKHKKYQGIVPELAAREHHKNLPVIYQELINRGKFKVKDIKAIAVTSNPGLPPALSTGLAFAKGLSISLNLPLIEVDHVKAHVWSVFVDPAFQGQEKPKFPLIALVVSGGHTQLMYFKSPLKSKIIGKTIDDAAGEVFDKVAVMLELSYPGGPVIEKVSAKGDEFCIDFPRPKIQDPDYDFSFSGLKTAVLYYIRDNQGLEMKKYKEDCAPLSKTQKNKLSNHFDQYFKADVAASFQRSVVDVLTNKTVKAAQKYKVDNVILGGGVAANSILRSKLALDLKEVDIKLYSPSLSLCGDNAAMIAGLAYEMIRTR